ncbi:MAG TPA: MarP family serine protease [Gaiellaceae bacterium]|nr:MarP family serine protease [Gaiellaceae bacterium]
MTAVDWCALAVVAVAAVLGMRKGLVAGALALAGVAVGAVLGSRLAPALLPGGDASAYTPLVALAGAAVGAVVLETVATLAGGALRRSLHLTPLAPLDALGGLLLGAAAGLAVVWVLGAVALHVPGQPDLRRAVQRSEVLARLNDVVPPSRLLDAIQRVDPFPAIVGPAGPTEPPDPATLQQPGVRAAAPSVVRVLGTACGLAVSGSGWVARPQLVVTAAHVVAGQRDTVVEASGVRLRARAVAYEPEDDVAVLRVDGLRQRPLPLGDGSPGQAVAILGYPENGPFAAAAGRIGRTATVISQDAYGRGPVRRSVTALSGTVRHGNSGGPAVDAAGEVETTVFASRVGSSGGFGVPNAVVRSVLADAGEPVSTGPCAP